LGGEAVADQWPDEYEAHSGEYKQTITRHGKVISKLNKRKCASGRRLVFG
jgi:hypothetical protein